MKQNKFDKETKLLLLAALQRGYFTDNDTAVLKSKELIPIIHVTVIDDEAKAEMQKFLENE